MKFVATSNYLIAGKIFGPQKASCIVDDDSLLATSGGSVLLIWKTAGCKNQAEVVAERSVISETSASRGHLIGGWCCNGIIVAILGVVAYLVSVDL